MSEEKDQGLIMTNEEFCEIITAYDGEVVDNIKQIALRSFNGEELKEFVEHCFELKNNDMNDELFGERHEQEEDGLYGKQHERQIMGLSSNVDICPSHKRKFKNDYIGWHLWAEKQVYKGIDQKQCDRCGRWLFPSEF